MGNFRQLLVERLWLTLIFIALAIVYFWASGEIEATPPKFKLTFHVLMGLVFFVLAFQIGRRRRAMLEMMGRHRKRY